MTFWKHILTALGFETRTPRNDSGGCCRQYDDAEPYRCACHERMGNEFWFLPTGSCLYSESDK